MNKKLLIVLLLAFLVRLIALDQSLWLDEAVTANVVSNLSYSEIITKFSPTDFHPPLFYLVEKFWTNIFGYSEIVLRFPSIIFSLITGWMIYLIGKSWKVGKLEGGNVGMWAAALFLFNPLIIYYSQEVRQYMLVTMFTTLIIYYLLRINGLTNYGRKRHPGASETSDRILNLDFISRSAPSRMTESHTYLRDMIFLNLCIFLSFLTFYGSIFFIFAIYFWLLIKREFKLLFLLLPGFILAVLLVFPLFIEQFANSKIALNDVKNWSLVLGKANLKNLLLIPIKFSIGRISFEPKILYWIIVGVWTAFVFTIVILERVKRAIGSKIGFYQSDSHRTSRMTQDSIFLWLFFIPLMIGFVVSFFSPLLQYFRFIYLIPLFVILLALGTKNNWQRLIILGGFLIFSFVYLLNPTYHREDWKSLVQDLKTKTIYMVPSSSDAVKYYDKKIEIKDLKSLQNLELENNLTIIPYTSEIHGVNYGEILSKKGYKLDSEKSYRELKIEEWSNL